MYWTPRLELGAYASDDWCDEDDTIDFLAFDLQVVQSYQVEMQSKNRLTVCPEGLEPSTILRSNAHKRCGGDSCLSPCIHSISFNATCTTVPPGKLGHAVG